MVSDELIEVYQCGSWDYEWSVMGIFRNERGEWLVSSDSGCSCNAPWERATISDFTVFPPHNFRDAILAAFSRINDMYLFGEQPDFREKRKIELKEAVYRSLNSTEF